MASDCLPHQVLHGESVMNQLKLSGTLDAVRLIQAGFPTRIPYEMLYTRYSGVLRDVPGINISALSPSEFCEAISEACGVSKSEYALGVNRMFFKMDEAQADGDVCPLRGQACGQARV
jgi:myosin VI